MPPSERILISMNVQGNIIWVTGAHGFIGRHLSRELARNGALVCGLGHGTWPEAEAEAWGVRHWLNGDIASSNLSYLQQLTGVPHAIFHLAGGSSVGAAIAQPHEDFARTVGSTAELLEWIRQNSPQTRLVAVSSAAVYGAGHDGAIREDAALSPYSPYGYHKLMMEQMCRSYGDSFGIRSAVTRLFSIYGPGLKKQLLWDLCNKFASGRDPIELGGTGEECRDWVYVRDVVSAVTACLPLTDAQSPVVNVGSGISTPVRDIARLMSNAWTEIGNHSPQISFSGKGRPGDPFSLVSEATRIQQISGPFQMTLEAGLMDYVEWFCRQSVGE